MTFLSHPVHRNRALVVGAKCMGRKKKKSPFIFSVGRGSAIFFNGHKKPPTNPRPVHISIYPRRTRRSLGCRHPRPPIPPPQMLSHFVFRCYEQSRHFTWCIPTERNRKTQSSKEPKRRRLNPFCLPLPVCTHSFVKPFVEALLPYIPHQFGGREEA